MTTTPTYWFGGTYDPRYADILAMPDGGFRMDFGNNTRPRRAFDEVMSYAPSGELADTDKIFFPGYREAVYSVQNVLLTNGDVGLAYIEAPESQHHYYNGDVAASIDGKEVRLSAPGIDCDYMYEAIALDDGGLMALWGQTVGKDEHEEIAFRRVSAQGKVLGDVVLLPSADGHEQRDAAMTELADGTIVIGWTDRVVGADTGEVIVQRYGQDGVGLGDPLSLASVAYYNPVAVTALAGGGYVVVWGNGPDTASTLQLFAADGTAEGGPVAVDGWTNGAITELQDGGFVLMVVKGSFEYSIQRFDANGMTVGDPIPTDYGYLQTLDDGRFVFASATGYTIYDPRDYAIDGTAGNDVIYGRLDGSEIFGFEGDDTLVGGGANDILHGASGNDKLQGMAGDDTLFGGEGDDSIGGGLGEDALDGGGGNDELRGLNGDDVLTGSGGADTLRGGPGADVFVYLRALDSGTDEVTRDTIIDFEVRKDRIDVSAIDADRLHAGVQAFTFIGDAAFSGVGQIRYEVQGRLTLIEADTNGDGKADMTIALKGAVALDASNFILTGTAPAAAGAYPLLSAHAADTSPLLQLA